MIKLTLTAYVRFAVLPTIALATAVGAITPYTCGAGFVISPPAGKNYITAEGTYAEHVQGITTNGVDAIYWSFTTKLVKTDAAGKLLNSTPDVIDHHGDLTYAGGKVYVAVNDRAGGKPGQFNFPNPNNPARQWIYEYDADLKYIKRYAVPQAIYGAGGVAYHDDRFWVVGGLPGPWLGGFDATTYNKNYVYEYDTAFKFVRSHELRTGNTDRGIQTVDFGCDRWWLGTYESNPPRVSAKSSSSWTRQIYSYNRDLTGDFTRFGLHSKRPAGDHADGSMGIAALPNGYFLIAGDKGPGGKRAGLVWMARPNRAGQLIILDTIPNSADELTNFKGDVIYGSKDDIKLRKKTSETEVRKSH